MTRDAVSFFKLPRQKQHPAKCRFSEAIVRVDFQSLSHDANGFLHPPNLEQRDDKIIAGRDHVGLCRQKLFRT